MAQADGVVANGSGSAVRADINTQLAAVFTNHSGATQPSDIKQHQFWYDESADILKIRNDADTDWISLREADGKVILLQEHRPHHRFILRGKQIQVFTNTLMTLLELVEMEVRLV